MIEKNKRYETGISSASQILLIVSYEEIYAPDLVPFPYIRLVGA